MTEHSSVTGKAPGARTTQFDNSEPPQHKPKSHVRFDERPTCTIAEACAASGLKRSKVYLLLGEGRLQSVKIDKRHLIKVPSLLRLLGMA
jgi:hypothetical protein